MAESSNQQNLLNEDMSRLSKRSADETIEISDGKFFEFGFKSIVQSNGTEWKKVLENPTTVDHLQNIIMEKFRVEEERAEIEESGDVELMKWVPVEPPSKKCKVEPTCISKSVGQDLVKYEHYGKYFDECSEHLSKSAANFSNVKNFNEWFYYEWEAQLYGIRNLVQQEIYREEMKKYRNTKDQQKKES
nr:uncharacterized protein LOC111516482 [Leptinotarsa decemlineata]